MSKKWGRGPTDCEWRVGLWECEARNNPYLIKIDSIDPQIVSIEKAFHGPMDITGNDDRYETVRNQFYNVFVQFIQISEYFWCKIGPIML